VLSHTELSRKYTTNGKVIVQPRAVKDAPSSPAPLGSPSRKEPASPSKDEAPA